MQNTTKIDIDVDQKINLPKGIIHKNFYGFNLIFAPKFPNWIVLDDEELNLYKALNKFTIKEVMLNFKDKTKVLQNLLVLQNLVSKIYSADFFENSPIKQEEHISNIQKMIHINLTNDCNMRCSHCFVSAGLVPKKEINTKEIIKKVKEIQAINKKTKITISGGEPLLFKGLFEILQALKENEISLFTNGTLINKDNIKTLSKFVSNIQISTEGISKECYEKNRGKGNYEKFKNAIFLIKEHGIALDLAVTILPKYLDDICENLIDFVKEIDYADMKIRLNNEIELAGNALNMQIPADFKEKSDIKILKLIKELKQIGLYQGANKQANTHFTNCGIGTNIVIDCDGKIYPCNKFSKYFLDFNSSAKDILKEFDEINLKTSTQNIKQCQKCELKFICAGGCRIDNLNLNGNMNKPICSENFKENIYKKLIFDSLI